MKYSVLGYFIGEGFSNVFKNKKSTGASLMIMCATMIIFGIFLILGENINHIVKEVEGSQGIQVFLNADATDEQVKELGEKIRNIEGSGEIMTNASRIINREIRKQRKAGLEQGLRQGIKLVAKKLKGKMDIKEISQITGLSESDIENL